jgi:hypothetical protein
MDNYASSGLENKVPILADDSNNVQNVGLYSSSVVPSVRDYCSATGAENFVKAGPVQSMIIPKSELTPQPKQSGGGFGFGILGNEEMKHPGNSGRNMNHPVVNTWQHGSGKSKRRSRRTSKNVKKRKSMKRKSIKRKSIKKRMKRKSMKKSMKSKTFNLKRKISNYTKGIKNKTKKIKLNFKKRRSYRGGNSTPMFIQEFNTKLSPDESMLALPTPLTRTIRNCNPLN